MCGWRGGWGRGFLSILNDVDKAVCVVVASWRYLVKMDHSKPMSSISPIHCSRNPPESPYIHTTATTRDDNSPMGPSRDPPIRTQLPWPHMYRPRQDPRPQMSESHRVRQPPGSREDFARYGETGSSVAETRFSTRRTGFSSFVQEMASGSSWSV